MRNKYNLCILTLFFSTSIFSSNNLENIEFTSSKQKLARLEEKVNFLDIPEFMRNDILSKFSDLELLKLRQINRKSQEIVMSFPNLKKLDAELKAATIAYNKIENLTANYKGNYYSGLLNKDLASLFDTLQIVADKGVLKAARRYLEGLKNMRKGSIEKEKYDEMLNKKAQYKEKLENNKDKH